MAILTGSPSPVPEHPAARTPAGQLLASIRGLRAAERATAAAGR
jgi:hypothetical protein